MEHALYVPVFGKAQELGFSVIIQSLMVDVRILNVFYMKQNSSDFPSLMNVLVFSTTGYASDGTFLNQGLVCCFEPDTE